MIFGSSIMYDYIILNYLSTLIFITINTLQYSLSLTSTLFNQKSLQSRYRLRSNSAPFHRYRRETLINALENGKISVEILMMLRHIIH